MLLGVYNDKWIWINCPKFQLQVNPWQPWQLQGHTDSAHGFTRLKSPSPAPGDCQKCHRLVPHCIKSSLLKIYSHACSGVRESGLLHTDLFIWHCGRKPLNGRVYSVGPRTVHDPDLTVKGPRRLKSDKGPASRPTSCTQANLADIYSVYRFTHIYLHGLYIHSKSPLCPATSSDIADKNNNRRCIHNYIILLVQQAALLCHLWDKLVDIFMCTLLVTLCHFYMYNTMISGAGVVRFKEPY